MADIEHKNNKNTVFYLCFRDFQQPENKRKPCKIVKIHNKTNDSKEDIIKRFVNISSGTSLLRQLGIGEGVWGMVGCVEDSELLCCDYTDNNMEVNMEGNKNDNRNNN